ncbi:MAG: hypothetical protein JW931_07880 [Methanomicrobiaceae archaeon]|nr:hypothetical protein [Methanomicrobiaceae archaeon]
MKTLYLIAAGSVIPARWKDYEMDLRAVAGEIRSPGLRKHLFLMLILVVPVILDLFQLLVFGDLLSPEFVIENLVLDYSDPNLQSMFFANYIHSPFDREHFIHNMFSYVVIGVLIWLFYYHVIPSSGASLPKNFLGINLILFFLAFPFAISGIVLFFRRMGSLPEEIRYGLGFSGIIWAFTSFLLFLMCFVLFMEIFTDQALSCAGSLKDLRKESVLVLCFISLALMAPVFMILTDIGTDRNPFAHFAGLSLGFIISAMVAICIDEAGNRRRLYCLFIIFFVVAAASSMWIFV